MEKRQEERTPDNINPHGARVVILKNLWHWRRGTVTPLHGVIRPAGRWFIARGCMTTAQHRSELPGLLRQVVRFAEYAPDE